MGLTRREQVAENLLQVQGRVDAALARASRTDTVTLIAVTKTHPASDARLLAELGVHDLGENRDQEAAPKAAELAAQNVAVRWHFIGQLQSNKAKSVAAYASMVHTVDRPSLLSALGRAAHHRLDVLLQYSVDGDPERGGAVLSELLALADAIPDTLRLRGVMSVAPLGMDPGRAFSAVAAAHEALLRAHPQATVRCIGMSEDFESAIAHGATHIRVGSALLGSRAVL